MNAPRPRKPAANSPPPFDFLLAEAATHAEAAPPGRDAKGRFVKGNPGGPGNPFARQVAKLRSALIDYVTEADMHTVAVQLLAQARLGNLPAIRLLLLYVLGKPAAAVNPDTLDIEEWRQLVQPLSEIMDQLPNALMSVPVERATDMVRTAQPFAQRMTKEELTDPIVAYQAEEEAEALAEANAEEDDKELSENEGINPRPRTEAPPSPNGHSRPTGSVPRWLHKVAGYARMSAYRWQEKGRPSG